MLHGSRFVGSTLAAVAALLIACGGGTGAPAGATPRQPQGDASAAGVASPSPSPSVSAAPGRGAVPASAAPTGQPSATAATAPASPSPPAPPTAPTTPSAAITVEIANFTFGAAAGVAPLRVRWANHDSVDHDVTATDGRVASGVIRPGASADLVFDRPGTFAYLCSVHPFMIGSVTVR